MGDDSNYGSYPVLRNLSVAIAGVASVSAYERRLDLETGMHITSYASGDREYTCKRARPSSSFLL